MTVRFSNFNLGSHTVVCYGSYPPAGRFYRYTTSFTTTNVCVFGFKGYNVWATVDGVESNHLTWAGGAGATPPAPKPAPVPQQQPDLARYAGHIVQWDGDTKPQKTAWYVGLDLKRRWIASTTTYACLKATGAKGPDVLPSSILDCLPDQPGVPATCGTCVPFIVIDSRGSGSQDVVSAQGQKFLDEMRRLKAPELVGVIRNNYPALGWTTFLGAVLQLTGGYHESAAAGSDSLRNELQSEARLCPYSKFFLTGYSQGAQVAADV